MRCLCAARMRRARLIAVDLQAAKDSEGVVAVIGPDANWHRPLHAAHQRAGVRHATAQLPAAGAGPGGFGRPAHCAGGGQQPSGGARCRRAGVCRLRSRAGAKRHGARRAALEPRAAPGGRRFAVGCRAPCQRVAPAAACDRDVAGAARRAGPVGCGQRHADGLAGHASAFTRARRHRPHARPAAGASACDRTRHRRRVRRQGLGVARRPGHRVCGAPAQGCDQVDLIAL
jgi:hypothetical protein